MLLLAVGLASAGCSVLLQPSGMVTDYTVGWRRLATEDDLNRMRDSRTTFETALAAARKSGHGGEIDREGALLEPDAALPGNPIPDGMYACRVIKLGARAPGNLDYIAYPAAMCRVKPDHNLRRLGKLTGSQRYVGIIFPNDQLRQVFLGTLVLSDERRALQYGQDEARDVAGYVERIGPSRWRLIMPRPHFESQIDVMDLVPMAAGAR